ncbi:MAG: hypothetical protein ABMA64_35095 [Myxococcota bacterium]
MLSPAPLSFSWGQYVGLLIEERGSLAELVRQLLEVAPASARLSDDPLTVERGLRRLRDRGSAPGEKYGRLLLRCFGLPTPIRDQVRALGQYHDRLSDLPIDVRRAQLRLWEGSPICESALASWIHLGLGSLAMRDLDLPLVERRLALARLGIRAAGPEASLELSLFEARLRSDRNDEAGAEAALAEADALVAQLPPGDDAACYVARILDQRAYRRARGWRTEPTRLEAALDLYTSIPADGPPFAGFRRAHGVAWCRWRQGAPGDALEAADEAVRQAGDGGFVRFRLFALSLRARILDTAGRDSSRDRARAGALAARLGDPASALTVPQEV